MKSCPLSGEALRVRAGWLLDGRGGPALRDVGISVQAGRIVSIAPWPEGQVATVDLSHATVLPALIDSHVHLALSGTVDANLRKAQLAFGPDQVRLAIRRHLDDHWRCGVAAVRDGGDRLAIAAEFRQSDRAPGAPVIVRAAGAAWHLQGRYGAMIGRALPPQGAPQGFPHARLNDCDHLKLIQSGLNSIDRFGYQGPPQFRQEQLDAMTAAAHAADRPVMVHANGQTAVRMAIQAGCDSIEHGYFMGVENLQRMAERGVVWVPTIIPMAALAQADWLTAPQRDVAHRTVDHQLAQVRQAVAAGVVIALGTDAGGQGVDHGVAVRHELQLLMAAGLAVEAAVRCATGVAARLLGLADRGELAPGRRADFIALAGPPEKLVDNLEYPVAGYLAGQVEAGANALSSS